MLWGYSIVPLKSPEMRECFFLWSAFWEAFGIVLKKLIAPTSAVGWYSLMVAICFFSGLIMLFLGLIGEYLGRMYLAQGNNPQYVIRNIYTGKKKNRNS